MKHATRSVTKSRDEKLFSSSCQINQWPSSPVDLRVGGVLQRRCRPQNQPFSTRYEALNMKLVLLQRPRTGFLPLYGIHSPAQPSACERKYVIYTVCGYAVILVLSAYCVPGEYLCRVELHFNEIMAEVPSAECHFKY